MKKTIFVIVFMCSLSSPVAAENYVGRVPWSQANVDALRAADKATVARFVNSTRPLSSMDILPVNVVESGWASVGEDERDFLVLLDFSERGYTNTLWIYSRGNAGELNIQEIDGWKMGKLKQMARDLVGDGKDELIIPTELGPGGTWSPLLDMPAWPAVYRVENGRYVDVSSDFASFYDKDVLPALNHQIREAQARVSREPFQQQTIAMSQMERNKLLRVLGRNPTAGLDQAYQWMNSNDSQVLQCAIATFADIGGHDLELHKAQQALRPALQREMATRGGG